MAGTFAPRTPNDARQSTGNEIPYRVPAWAFSTIGMRTMVLPSRIVKSACRRRGLTAQLEQAPQKKARKSAIKVGLTFNIKRIDPAENDADRRQSDRELLARMHDATPGDDRELLVPLVRDGEVVGREHLDAARARHLIGRAELPPSAQQMSRGEPVIPTVFEGDQD